MAELPTGLDTQGFLTSSVDPSVPITYTVSGTHMFSVYFYNESMKLTLILGHELGLGAYELLSVSVLCPRFPLTVEKPQV